MFALTFLLIKKDMEAQKLWRTRLRCDLIFFGFLYILPSIYLAVYLVHDFMSDRWTEAAFSCIIRPSRGALEAYTQASPFLKSQHWVCVPQRRAEFPRTFFIMWRNRFFTSDQEDFVQRGREVRDESFGRTKREEKRAAEA